MILDVCPKLKIIKISEIDEDADCEGKVSVNLDKYLQLESIDINSYPKQIKIFSKQDINTKLKEIRGGATFSISDNLILLALESYREVNIEYDGKYKGQ